jgi:phage/plasmid-associated DNA primase
VIRLSFLLLIFHQSRFFFPLRAPNIYHHFDKDICCHRSLQQIDKDKFAIADLFGKMANTFADLESMKLLETGNYKMAVAGDWLQGEHKFEDSFKFRNKAKLWFSTNEIPESDDKIDA